MPTRTRGIDRQLHFEPPPSLKRACCQRQVACCTLFRALYVNACMAAHHRPVHHRPVRACVRKKAPPQPVSRSAACCAHVRTTHCHPSPTHNRGGSTTVEPCMQAATSAARKREFVSPSGLRISNHRFVSLLSFCPAATWSPCTLDLDQHQAKPPNFLGAPYTKPNCQTV